MHKKKPFTYRLRDWLHRVPNYDFDALCLNPNAMDYIRENWYNLHGFNRKKLSANPEAWEYRIEEPEENLDKARISSNPAAVWFLIERPHLIDWREMRWNERCAEVVIALYKRNKNYPFPWDLLMHRIWMEPAMADFLGEHFEELHFEELCNNVVWRGLLVNPNPVAIQLVLEKGQDKLQPIDWHSSLCKKPEYFAAHYRWTSFNQNPCPLAVAHLIANPHKIIWDQLAENPSNEAYEFMRMAAARALWPRMGLNKNPKVIDLMFSRPEWIVPDFLSSSPHSRVLAYLEQTHFESIDWHQLSSNPCPFAIQMMRRNLTLVDWGQLPANTNPEALELLEYFVTTQTQTTSSWFSICHVWRNPHIFYPVYDYRFLEERLVPIKEELLETVMHPDRIDELYTRRYGLCYADVVNLLS